jgi:hypothetical protein
MEGGEEAHVVVQRCLNSSCPMATPPARVAPRWGLRLWVVWRSSEPQRSGRGRKPIYTMRTRAQNVLDVVRILESQHPGCPLGGTPRDDTPLRRPRSRGRRRTHPLRPYPRNPSAQPCNRHPLTCWRKSFLSLNRTTHPFMVGTSTSNRPGAGAWCTRAGAPV